MDNILKGVRKNHFLTQEELGKLVGVSRQTILFLEKGTFNPSLQLAHKIASIFDMLIEDIFIFDNFDNITPDKTGNVYFISDGDYVKIGVSKDSKDRLNKLQTGSSKKLELVFEIVCENPYEVEANLHRQFSKYRHIGEWFVLSKEILEYVNVT